MKGGFGQSNVCYRYDNHGNRKPGSWMDKAIDYVLKYDKENVLKNPYAEVISEDAAMIAQEQRAGFQSNPEIRRAVEEHAMREVRKALQKLGYDTFQDTSAFKPYDYTCMKNGTTFYVEVKGTQTGGKTVILTKNEIAHVRANPGMCVLVLVRNITVSGKGRVSVSGGTSEIRQPWQLHPDDLVATQFVWTVK